MSALEPPDVELCVAVPNASLLLFDTRIGLKLHLSCCCCRSYHCCRHQTHNLLPLPHHDFLHPQLAARQRQQTDSDPRSRMPTHQMLQTISKVLDLNKQFPDLDPAPLLRPIIALARTQYSWEALVPKLRRMKRLLPDAELREALLSRGECDPSIQKGTAAGGRLFNF